MTGPAFAVAVPALATSLAALAVALVPRRWPLPQRRRFERVLAGLGAVALVAVKVDEAVHNPGGYAWLPLHVCDLSNMAGIVALLRGSALARAITLYFGLGLSSFALAFPDLGAGPGSPEYWLFWTRHGWILAAALYDLLVRGYRPAWRDYARWCLFGGAYLAVVLVVNALLGTNFAFIADRTPAYTGVVEVFGPWPGRAVIMLALTYVHAAALTIVAQALPVGSGGAIDSAGRTGR